MNNKNNGKINVIAMMTHTGTMTSVMIKGMRVGTMTGNMTIWKENGNISTKGYK